MSITYSKVAALRNKPQEQSPFRPQMKPFWIGRQGWLVKAVFMAVDGKRGWRRGYLVKTKTFVFGRIAEISARYRRQNDRTDAARLFCCHISLAKKVLNVAGDPCDRSLGPILRTDP